MADDAEELTTAQACQLLGLSRWTLIRATEAGSLSPRRAGRDLLFRKDDLLRFQQERVNRYATLAMTGTIPIVPTHWSAAVMREADVEEVTDALADALAAGGTRFNEAGIRDMLQNRISIDSGFWLALARGIRALHGGQPPSPQRASASPGSPVAPSERHTREVEPNSSDERKPARRKPTNKRKAGR